MAYLYRHIRLDNNEPFYIGISKKDESNFARAYCCHPKQRNPHWLKVFEKTKIEVEILFENIDYAFAKQKEIEFISLYKRRSEGGTLVNLTKGGDGVLGFKNPKLAERNKTGIWKGKKHTEKTKRKMSLASKGVKKSPETIEKLRKSKIGIGLGVDNPNYKGKIYCYKDGEVVTEFLLIKDVADYFNISVTHASRFIDSREDRFKTLKGHTLTRKLH